MYTTTLMDDLYIRNTASKDKQKGDHGRLEFDKKWKIKRLINRQAGSVQL